MTPGKHSELTLADHRTDVAAFLEVVKDVPCGTTRRGRTKTLYKAIADLTRTNSQKPIGEKAVMRLASEIVGFKAQVEYSKVLLDAKRDGKSRSAAPRNDFFISFIPMLAAQHGDLFLQILGSVEPNWRREILQTLELEIRRQGLQAKTDLYLHSIRERIKEEFGVSEEWTNLPKVGLNAATVTLCGIFRELTGGPQYGLVGQLLFRADLEDATGIAKRDRYSKLAKRVGDREQRHSQS